ncbi:uncharacterized protein LOC130130990 [Lampris incognitus]|uniref:uncharacterized protein LOC130130990 n=1 Tax=Lampris incognitus TaxID=2546036 RepID=UPI0024B576F8|nr:uncharacterized protein LOC130130990 [Lampris incognitus]
MRSLMTVKCDPSLCAPVRDSLPAEQCQLVLRNVVKYIWIYGWIKQIMFHYMLVYVAYYFSRWIPRNQRLKFQLVNVIFMALVLVPQFYVMGRPKSSRYCQQPLLNNLSAFVALSFVASGFSVIFTLIDPVPQSFRAAYHVFGLLSFSQGLCTTILTLTAAACAHTTPELYYLSVSLTAACTFATGKLAPSYCLNSAHTVHKAPVQT